MQRLLIFLIFLLAYYVVANGKECKSDSNCGKNQCCLKPEEGSRMCQDLSPEGEECDPVNKVNSCQCERGKVCTRRVNSSESDIGVCQNPENAGEKCGNLRCPKNYCCIRKSGEPPSCQPNAKYGEVCRISQKADFDACGCEDPYYCKYDENPEYIPKGTCIDPDELGKKCENEDDCDEDQCCTRPWRIFRHCKARAQTGETCETITNYKACPCIKDDDICLPRNASNTLQGTCIPQDQMGDKCGRIYCKKSECCLEPSSGDPKCEPFGEKGDICALPSKDGEPADVCPCSEGLDCIPQRPTDPPQGLCTEPKQVTPGQQCGYRFCPEDSCCITVPFTQNAGYPYSQNTGYGYARNISYCLFYLTEGQFCNPNPSIQTYTCGCKKGLECRPNSALPNPTTGSCEDPSKHQKESGNSQNSS